MTGTKTLKEQCAERKAKRLRERGLDRTDLEKKRDRQRGDRERKRKKAALEAKRNKLKGRKGRAPKKENGWYMLNRIVMDGSEPWDVWRQRMNPDNGWINIKVFATGRVARKANYWLGYNWWEKRWADNVDDRSIRQHRPTLFKRTRQLVEGK